MIRVIRDENNILICAWRVGIWFFFKEQDEDVGWPRDTGGPKRCGTCGAMSAQSGGRAVR